MKVFKSLLLLAVFFSAVPAIAGSYQGKVTGIFAYSGKVFISVKNGSFDNPNTCTTQASGMSLWLDPALEYDKAMLSLALSAKVTDRLVWVAGGSCISGPSGKAAKLSAIDFKG